MDADTDTDSSGSGSGGESEVEMQDESVQVSNLYIIGFITLKHSLRTFSQANIRSEISTMSFEELMKLKDKLGAKVYNETVFGKHKVHSPSSAIIQNPLLISSTNILQERTKTKVQTEFKRDNRNRPREMGAKRPVPFLGNAKLISKSRAATVETVRDPRFDPKCGEYDAKKFKDNFAFVDEIKQRELVELRDRLKHCDDFKEQKKIKYLIQRMQNQNTEAQKLKVREKLRSDEKQEIVTARKEGKTPHYMTDRKLGVCVDERERK